MNLKKVKTKDVEFHCSAVEAFNFDSKIQRAYTLKFFNSNQLKQIYLFEFPVVIECKKVDEPTKYQVISNWDKLINGDVKDVLTVCNYKQTLTNDEIENISWFYVINQQLPKWKYSSDINSLNDLLMEIPESFLNELKAQHNTKSYIKLITELTGKSDTAIRNKIQSAKKTNTD